MTVCVMSLTQFPATCQTKSFQVVWQTGSRYVNIICYDILYVIFYMLWCFICNDIFMLWYLICYNVLYVMIFYMLWYFICIDILQYFICYNILYITIFYMFTYFICYNILYVTIFICYDIFYVMIFYMLRCFICSFVCAAESGSWGRVLRKRGDAVGKDLPVSSPPHRGVP